ncbi:hypothetical protein ANO11243_032610 [Dothideomycetidae sp. 11243]|nr:hypothetical protein ANO11243_032610 [fungal sp. No.11243]
MRVVDASRSIDLRSGCQNACLFIYSTPFPLTRKLVIKRGAAASCEVQSSCDASCRVQNNAAAEDAWAGADALVKPGHEAASEIACLMTSATGHRQGDQSLHKCGFPRYANDGGAIGNTADMAGKAIDRQADGPQRHAKKLGAGWSPANADSDADVARPIDLRWRRDYFYLVMRSSRRRLARRLLVIMLCKIHIRYPD